MNVPLFEFGPWSCTFDAASGFLFQGPSTIGVRFGVRRSCRSGR